MDKIAKEQLEKICRACGWCFNEEDRETALCIIKALRVLDILKYREAHLELVKAAEIIIERYGR